MAQLIAEKTVATLSWFLLAMIVYPDKQRKCQEELDAVVGRSRMPTIDDRNNLPYLRATVREILRWRPNTPTGLSSYLCEPNS
jgi:cytochrome P450